MQPGCAEIHEKDVKRCYHLYVIAAVTLQCNASSTAAFVDSHAGSAAGRFIFRSSRWKIADIFLPRLRFCPLFLYECIQVHCTMYLLQLYCIYYRHTFGTSFRKCYYILLYNMYGNLFRERNNRRLTEAALDVIVQIYIIVFPTSSFWTSTFWHFDDE